MLCAFKTDLYFCIFFFFTVQVLFRVTVENYGREPTRVWCLKCLHDYTVVSGDSLGHVQLWDGSQGTLLKSFSQHTADVTALAVSADERTVFASGFDHKIVMLKRVQEVEDVSAASGSHTNGGGGAAEPYEATDPTVRTKF